MFVQHLPEKRRRRAPNDPVSIEWCPRSVILPTTTKRNSMGGGPGVGPSGIDGEIDRRRSFRFFKNRVVKRGIRGPSRVRSHPRKRNQLPRNERELGGHDENGEKPTPRFRSGSCRCGGGAGRRPSPKSPAGRKRGGAVRRWWLG